MCLSIGTPKSNKFSICSKWTIYYFSVSQNLGTIQANYNCLSIGTPQNHHFPSETIGKVVELGVPIFKYFRVCIAFLGPVVQN